MPESTSTQLGQLLPVEQAHGRAAQRVRDPDERLPIEHGRLLAELVLGEGPDDPVPEMLDFFQLSFQVL